MNRSKPLTKWDRERRDKARELASLLTDGVNGTKIDVDAFLGDMMNRHRTLQQACMRLLLQLIYKWAEMDDKGRYDLRNEQTVKTCSKIKAFLEEEGFYLPYV